MSSLKFNYLNYPFRLYYNSLLNVIQSLVFYPHPSSWKSFLPHQYFGTFPVIYLFFLKSVLEKMIGHLLSSSSTQKKKHFERVNIQHTPSTKWWPTVYYLYEKNFFEVKLTHCFLIKDFHDFEKRSEEGRTNFESEFRKF